MKTSQQTKILNLLSDNQFHCSSEFYAMYIADPRTRICELKKKGYNLESRACKISQLPRRASEQLIGSKLLEGLALISLKKSTSFGVAVAFEVGDY